MVFVFLGNAGWVTICRLVEANLNHLVSVMLDEKCPVCELEPGNLFVFGMEPVFFLIYGIKSRKLSCL